MAQVLNNQSSSKDRIKEKDIKSSSIKKKSEEIKPSYNKEKFSESRPKPRTGKSYLEERQRLAERREEQKKKLSHSQSTSAVPDSKPSEEKSDSQESKSSEEKSATETKVKDRDNKQAEKPYKREESRRSSYKYDRYESKREKDNDDPRRAKRNSEKNYNKGDDDKYEDGGRKRYSESRKFNDSSQREKFKDKEKAKSYSQKKSESKGKSKAYADKPIKSKEVEVDRGLQPIQKEPGEDSETKSNPIEKDQESKLDVTSSKFIAEENLISRRNSLDSQNSNCAKPPSLDKLAEKKRRNSFGCTKEESSSNDKPIAVPGKKIISKPDLAPSDDSTTVETSKSEEKAVPKRRNSTGETQAAGKASARRNSLGSEDSKKASNYKHRDFEDSEKKVNENKQEQSVRDPRTERRIRNKDRPAMEIYRPGMGRFSKQRLGREKAQGSSTEVDSPSPSPSPTPMIKPKAH